MTTVLDPHAAQFALTIGPSPQHAQGVLILLHGRGASAEGMIEFYEEMNLNDLHVIAPRALHHTWYPYSFLNPLENNQPYLDSALKKVDSTVTELIAAGIASDRIAIAGFSQGACLASEYVARHPRRYGAVMILTGGLIGPPGTPREYPGSFEGTPIFIGTSDPDPHVPLTRVHETERVLKQMGAVVTLQTYPGMTHTINAEEVEHCRALLLRLVGRG